MKRVKVIDERGKVHHISPAALKGGGEHHVHVHIHIHGPEGAVSAAGYGAGYAGYAGYSGYGGYAAYAGYGKRKKKPAKKVMKGAGKKRR